MKWGVIQFPGSNNDDDCLYVLRDIFKQDAEFIWHKDKPKKIETLDAVLVPGGFSYGDYLRAGAIAKVSPIMEAVKAFADKGGLVLGICNGFQILLEMGLLPGAMMRNKDLKFICDTLELKVEHNESRFSKGYKAGEIIKLPVAHMEGNYTIGDAGLAELEKNNQILFRYQKNPNGSKADIAGIINKRGNVLGMMPHPERRSESMLGGEDGKRIFEAAISSL